MALKNPWIGYLSRSYEQIKTDVISRFPTRLPEITDRTEQNILVRMVSVWAGLTEMLSYYLDRRARETFIGTAQRYASGVKIARLYDYRIHGAIPAYVMQRFYVDEPGAAITIPAGTTVSTDEGITFTTTADATIPANGTEILVEAIQQTEAVATPVVTANTLYNPYRAVLPVTEPGGYVADNLIQVEDLNGVIPRKETLAATSGTTRAYVPTLNEAGQMELRFGDGIAGSLLNLGETLTVSYGVTRGLAGRVGLGTIKNVIQVPGYNGTRTIKTTNPAAAVGGADPESLEELRKNIPLFVRTLMRAVTEDDYRALASLAPGVAKAGVEFNCGKKVNLFVAPAGGGLPSAGLLANVENYFEGKRMVTTKVKAYAAGEVHIKLDILIRLVPSALVSVTLAEVKNRLKEFISVAQQEIRGGLQIGDVYQIIENTPGVASSDVRVMVPVPYARPVDHSTPLVWTVDLQAASRIPVRWKAHLITVNSFDLFRDGAYIGNYQLGATLNFPEVIFRIDAGAYTLGQNWEFYTYPYNKNLTLNEPSIPVSVDADLTITTIGGIA